MYTDTFFDDVKIEPAMDVLSVSLTSPSGEWPYDPVFDDPSYEVDVTGESAGACSENTDYASIDYEINKAACGYSLILYQNTLGWVNVPVVSAGGDNASLEKGAHSVPWSIGYDFEDQYFAKVKAWGALGETADSDTETSDEESIVRKTFYTSDTESVTSGEKLVVWEMTDEVYERLVGYGIAAGVAVGSYYLVPARLILPVVVGVAITEEELENLLYSLVAAPAWMDEHNATFDYPAWDLRFWTWSDSEAGYVGSMSHCYITASETYDDETPSPGDVPMVQSFHNVWSDEGYSDAGEYTSEFGLLPPELIPNLE